MDYIMDFILLGIIYILFFYKRWRKKSTKVFIQNSLMYIYVVMVLYVTLMPFPVPLGGTNNLFMDTANFIPFRDLRMHYGGAGKEILLNILMMVPFGFLYPLITKKGIIRTVLMTFIFSLSIECCQLLSTWLTNTSRAFDVTDLITNTWGGLIGYLVFIVFRPVLQRMMKD